MSGGSGSSVIGRNDNVHTSMYGCCVHTVYLFCVIREPVSLLLFSIILPYIQTSRLN